MTTASDLPNPLDPPRAPGPPGPPEPPGPQQELLGLYRANRLDEQARYYGDRARLYERARRWTVSTSAVLLVLASLFGALGSADMHRRSIWAFVAASAAAFAAAVASYEASAGFERLSRQYEKTLAALRLADAAEMAKAGEDVGDYVGVIEAILLSEVELWWQHVPSEAEGEGDS
jgi:hypothetical protein